MRIEDLNKKTFKWLKPTEAFFGHIKIEGTSKITLISAKAQEVVKNGDVKLKIETPRGWRVEKHNSESKLLENQVSYLGEAKFCPKFVYHMVKLSVGENISVIRPVEKDNNEEVIAQVECVNKSGNSVLLGMKCVDSHRE